jgi:hypothetical protein
MGKEGVLPRGKAAGHKANHLPPSSAEVKNGWRCTSNLSYAFMVAIGQHYLFYCLPPEYETDYLPTRYWSLLKVHIKWNKQTRLPLNKGTQWQGEASFYGQACITWLLWFQNIITVWNYIENVSLSSKRSVIFQISCSPGFNRFTRTYFSAKEWAPAHLCCPHKKKETLSQV